jgi:site-specific recombinase XerD
MHQGPLGEYIDLYAAQLEQQGYRRETGRRRLKVVADLSRWLEHRKLTANDIDEGLLDRYCRYRRRYNYVDTFDHSALGRLLALLRDIGVCRSRPLVLPDAQEQAAEDFKQYLSEKIGLAPATIVRYLRAVRRFVREQFPNSPPCWTELSAAHIIDFVERHAHDHGPYEAHSMCSTLRSFLRFLRRHGKIERDLANAVPSVARWKLSALPGFLTPEQVQQALSHCDRQGAIGKRDYAILLLLARLGLRANEIVTLTLDDIDWRSGQLTLRHTKTEEKAHLPLPAEVGEALVDYLQNGRPNSLSRRVFLREMAPHIGFSDSSRIYWIARKTLTHAGVDTPRKGSHLFGRHSLATHLLRQGASLSEIGQLLRHKDLNSTRIYAKVDLTALRALVLPWPGGVQ